MTAWVAHSDPLLVSIDQAVAGQNYKDNRTIWHGLPNVTLLTGGIVGAVWYKDYGPLGVDAAILEPRAFCTKGALTFSFTGTTLIIRLNIAFSWFTDAAVRIDGAAPSTLGLLTAVDTLSCDAATYQRFSDGYLDVILADGLSNAAHTCTITIDSLDPQKFFSLSGFKVGTLTTQPIARTGGWLVATESLLSQNLITLTITNDSSNTVVNPTMTFFPASLVDGTGGALSSLTAATLDPGATLVQTVLPVFTGGEISGTFPYDLTLSAEYSDPDGLISHTTTKTAAVGNASLVAHGTWFTDTGTPDSETRIFTNVFGTGTNLELFFSGDSVTFTIQTSAGFSDIGIYAADNTTLLDTMTCNVDTGGLLATHTTSGFGAGNHTLFLRKSIDDGLFVVFVKATWSVTGTYTLISETVRLNLAARQPVAMLAQNVVVGDYDLTFDAPIADVQDYSGTPVRQNTDLVYTEVLSRFPSFCVFYQSGQRDLLAEYDILVVDPLAAHTADVIHWQSLGIKVFGYISSGEEVGFYQDRYDFASALAPNAGSGPGGYANYYMFTKLGSFPDQDGVWAAYYINPDPAVTDDVSGSWPDRLENYYAPQVLGGPLLVTDEVVTTKTVTIAAGSRIVFDTVHSPIDSDETITVKTFNGSHTYTIFSDYTFNAKTGAVVLAPNVSPAVISGAQLKISYTRKGHRMDGVFFDTVDTPDVYGSDVFGYQFVAGYAAKFATMINNFAAAHPTARIISNRGFTILPDIIRSCSAVMFESWLTLPTDIVNLAITDYFRIADVDTVAYNDAVNQLLRTLRLSHEFDVLSLNYCRDNDDDLRAYCRTEDAKRGYLSWQTTIFLNQPGPNNVVDIPGQPISTNAFVRYKSKAL